MLGLLVKPGSLDGLKGAALPVDPYRAAESPDSQSSFRTMLDAAVSSPVEVEKARTRDEGMSESLRHTERTETSAEAEHQPGRGQADRADRAPRQEAAREKTEKKDAPDVTRPDAKALERMAGHPEKPESGAKALAVKEAASRKKTAQSRAERKEETPVAEKPRAKDDKTKPLGQVMQQIEMALRAVPDSIKDAKGIRETLNEVRDALAGKSRDHGAEPLESLYRRLRDFVKRLESGREDARDNREKALLPSLAREAARIVDALEKHVKRPEKGKEGAHTTEARGADTKEHGAEKHFAVPVNGKEDAKEPLHAKGGGQQAQPGMQFAGASHARERAAHQAALPQKSVLFDEQLQQLMQGAKLSVRDNRNATLSLRLHPESLGRMSVNLGLEGGTLVGRFLVESPDAKNALVEQLASVRSDLAEAGIMVGDFQVDVRGQDARGAGEGNYDPVFIPRGVHETVAESYDGNSERGHDGALDVIA
ncbi:MAG: flagellar hook-length control protein FliK [Spirochaetes bacterium]|nr:MAG: flagellar hook-length control protein FliK [Spirochaetota bacterium]